VQTPDRGHDVPKHVGIAGTTAFERVFARERQHGTLLETPQGSKARANRRERRALKCRGGPPLFPRGGGRGGGRVQTPRHALQCRHHLERTTGGTAMPLTGKKIIILIESDYEDLEVHYPRLRLLEEQATVVCAGTGAETYTGKRGYPLRV